MSIKVNISFKESERDMFNFLDKQISASYYLKQLIKEKMNLEKVKMLEKKPKSEQF